MIEGDVCQNTRAGTRLARPGRWKKKPTRKQKMRDNYTFRCTEKFPLTFLVDIETGWMIQPFQDDGEYTFKSCNSDTEEEVSVYVRVGFLNDLGIDLNGLHADLCMSMFSEDMSGTSRRLFGEEETAEQEPYRYSRKTQKIVEFWVERGLQVNRVIPGVTCYQVWDSSPFIIFTKSDANTSEVSIESVPPLFRVQLGTDGKLYSNFAETWKIWSESETWKHDLQGLANEHGSFDYFDKDGKKQKEYHKDPGAAPSPPHNQ